jgi:hypothetical protein
MSRHERAHVMWEAYRRFERRRNKHPSHGLPLADRLRDRTYCRVARLLLQRLIAWQRYAVLLDL